MAYEVSIFLKNKIGHFEEIAGLLREGGINIRSLTLNDISHGWGVLNLLVDQPENAYTLLTGKGHSVIMREIIALGMEDKTGGLDELLVRLAKAGIHFDNAYTRLLSKKQLAILILEVADVMEAKERLVKNNINILDDSVVYSD
jgi:hypothetical protein